MKERVFGIETEYAVIYHPGRFDRSPPSKLSLYRRFEAALRGRVRSLPNAFSPFRAKVGRFLENGASFHYEAMAEHFEHGLIEMASPECRDPYTLLCYERAKDELVEELAEEVNSELDLAGYSGRVRIGKNNVDSAGHTFGSHENYWVDDPLSLAAKSLLLPLSLLLWGISVPVLTLVMGVVVGVQVVLLVGVLATALVLLAAGGLVRLVRPALSRRFFYWVQRQAGRLDAERGTLIRWLQRLVAPIHPLMNLHSALYNLFLFRGIRRHGTAFLVTRTLYSGAGAVSFDSGPLFRLAQRPPFLRKLARIFTEGDERPVFETRDPFFRPWSLLSNRRRLHLMLGDANLSESALALRVGTTALVLEAIESGQDVAWPELRDPLQALNLLNRDASLERELELADGSRTTALEIQRVYLEGVRRVLAQAMPIEQWKARILRDWEDVLTRLKQEPESLLDRLDWLAKRKLVQREIQEPEDWGVLEREAARVLEDGAILSDVDRRLRELAFRIWRVDLRYHELGPKGGFRRLEIGGQMRRLSDPQQVLRARTEPPEDTRAWARGQAIKLAHSQALSGGVAWHRVRVGKFGWRWFSDPLDPQR